MPAPSSFSASIPPANAAAALVALKIMREEPERVQRLIVIGERMRRSLRELGFNIGASVTPIIHIIIGDDMQTLIAWKALFEAGVFVNPVLSPAVPAGQQLLRTSYMATLLTRNWITCWRPTPGSASRLG